MIGGGEEKGEQRIEKKDGCCPKTVSKRDKWLCARRAKKQKEI